MSANKKNMTILLVTVLLAPVALFLLPLCGRTFYSPGILLSFAETMEQFADADPMVQIFWGERFPKTLLAMMAGSGLALAGMILQALFRNPLATPYTLGIAGGASFGATLYLFYATALTALGIPVFFLGVSTVTWSAFTGAILATIIVFALSGGRDTGSGRMLLAGVAVGYFFSSLILCFQYVADQSRVFLMIRWTMGGIDQCDMRSLLTTGCCVGVSCIILFLFSRELNLLLTGEERATSLGLRVDVFRIFLFLLSSMIVAVIVAVCGPIGFVGLMVPHLCRLLVGNDHRLLIPVVFFFGATFLAFCHTLSRILLYPTILPVGMITSLLGGPFFLWILLSKKE